jgi:outer membrane murein-binding lipoprotein Lpp
MRTTKTRALSLGMLLIFAALATGCASTGKMKNLEDAVTRAQATADEAKADAAAAKTAADEAKAEAAAAKEAADAANEKAERMFQKTMRK